jgi:hypothetical protein
MKTKKVMLLTGAGIICYATAIFCCGGGVLPYIPSGTGAGANTNTSKQFYLIDKSVTYSMLDGKTLQPLFRNIVNSGNGRDSRNIHHDKKADSTSVADKDKKEQCPADTSSAEPVLNLHKLH